MVIVNAVGYSLVAAVYFKGFPISLCTRGAANGLSELFLLVQKRDSCPFVQLSVSQSLSLSLSLSLSICFSVFHRTAGCPH